MKALQNKLLILIVSSTLFPTLVVMAIAFSNYGRIVENNSGQIMQLMCSEKRQVIDPYYNQNMDEEMEQLQTVTDEYLSEKIEIKVGEKSIYLESSQLAKAIMKIPERKRIALLLAVVLEYSIGEIATQLNVSKKTVTDYKYEALSSLRKEVRQNGKEE